MSTVSTLDSRADHSRQATHGAGSTTFRIWPAAVLLVVFWMLLHANHAVAMSAAMRFMTRMGTLGIGLLTFLVWWLSRSSIRWTDRLLAIAVTLGLGALALRFTDRSIDSFGLLLSSLPIVLTVWIAWLAVARKLSPTIQRAGFFIAMLLVFAYFTLVRFDGLYANQQAEMNWRWTNKKEQDFLTAHTGAAHHPAPGNTTSKNWTLLPGDCPEFRGPQRDGVVTGETIVSDWSAHPPALLWRKKVGPGWSGMIVVDGHLVTQEQRGTVESVVCYDAATGDELWAHDDPIRFEESLAGAGPRGTPTFADGRIYSLGAKGTLNCLVPETGAVEWSRDITKDAEVTPAEMPIWGYSVSPLVIERLVIVFAGGTKDKSILAYHANDGKLAWSRAGGKQSYSSPQLAPLGGKKLILMHDTSAVRALSVTDGAQFWSHPNGSEILLPMIQPHVVGPSDLVVAIKPGLARVEVTQQLSDTIVAPRWETNKLRPDFSDFVVHKGSIYGLNDGVLCCLDLETGNQLWKKSRIGAGQLVLLADQDALLASNEKGEIILVSVNRDGPKEECRFQAIDGKTWNGPVLVGNHMFLRNAAEMAGYEVNVLTSPKQSPASAQPTNAL